MVKSPGQRRRTQEMGVYVLSPEPSRGDYKQKLKGSVLIILGAHVWVKDQTTMQWRGPHTVDCRIKSLFFPTAVSRLLEPSAS